MTKLTCCMQYVRTCTLSFPYEPQNEKRTPTAIMNCLLLAKELTHLNFRT